MVSTSYYPTFPKKRRYNSDCENEEVSMIWINPSEYYGSSRLQEIFMNTHSTAQILTMTHAKNVTPKPPHQCTYEHKSITFWRPWDDTANENYRSENQTSPETCTTHHEMQKCKLCSQEFTRRDNLTRHLKSKHNYKMRPCCRYCLKGLSRKDAVLRHELSCHYNPTRQQCTHPNASALANSPQKNFPFDQN